MLNYVDIRETRPKLAMHDAVTGNGGPMVDMACHFIDLMRYFTNSDPISVYAVWNILAENREMLRTIEHKAPDTANIVVKFTSGDILNITLCWGLPQKIPGQSFFQAVGSDGFIKATSISEPKITVFREGGEELIAEIPVNEEKELINCEKTVFDCFILEIEGIGKSQCSFTDGIMGLETSLAAIKSSVYGRVVTIAEILQE